MYIYIYIYLCRCKELAAGSSTGGNNGAEFGRLKTVVGCQLHCITSPKTVVLSRQNEDIGTNTSTNNSTSAAHMKYFSTAVS